MKTLLLTTTAIVAGTWGLAPQDAEESEMYGLIGKMTAAPEQRDALIEALRAGAKEMPGCLSYVIAKDEKDANAIWVTEVWDRKESHEASLQLPAVQQAIARGRPLIAGFGERFVTVPVGGHGLAQPPGSESSSERTQDQTPAVPPTPEHEWLLELQGEWKAEIAASLGPGTEPVRTEQREIVRSLGGVWVLAESFGDSNGTPMSSVLTLGYDTIHKRFVGTWVDSMQTNPWSYTGQLDESRTVLTLEAEGPTFGNPQQLSKYRVVITLKGPDHKVIASLIEVPGGEWFEFVTADYRRTKAAKEHVR